MEVRAEGVRRDPFLSFHPAVNFLYFSVMIIFAVAIFHPVTSTMSLAGALAYAILLRGKKALGFFIKMPFVIMLLIFIMNPVFVHKGITIFFMIGDIQITKEAFVYGGCSAMATGAVIMWFYCYSQVMTSDRFMAVFGKIAPASSLVFSMVLRFLPRLTEKAGRISEAQDCILCSNNEESVKEIETSKADRETKKIHKKRKIKKGIQTTSILTTWALENSIETADSMRARGYGLKGRTNYSGFKMTAGDAALAAVIAGITVMVIIAKAMGSLYFAAYPIVYFESMSAMTAAAVVAHTILSLAPVLMFAREAMIWKRSVSRI